MRNSQECYPSSASIVSLSPEVLRLPVEPSHGNYFELGVSKSFFGEFRVDANVYGGSPMRRG